MENQEELPNVFEELIDDLTDVIEGRMSKMYFAAKWRKNIPNTYDRAVNFEENMYTFFAAT